MLRSEKVEFNQGGEFLEMSVNVARDGKKETKYLRLARGYYGSDGEPRYKRGGVTLPADKKTLEDLSKLIASFDITDVKGGGAGAPE